jgi:hypothetical protein
MRSFMFRFFMIFLISLSVSAEDQIYSFGELKVVFIKIDGVIVNRSCKNKKCEAFQKSLNFSKTPLSPALLIGGKNPSAVRCKELMGGEVIIGTDRSGDEQSVCQFKDGSYLI